MFLQGFVFGFAAFALAGVVGVAVNQDRKIRGIKQGMRHFREDLDEMGRRIDRALDRLTLTHIELRAELAQIKPPLTPPIDPGRFVAPSGCVVEVPTPPVDPRRPPAV